MEYRELTTIEEESIYGGVAELGALIIAFGFIAIITVVVYKIFGAKKGDITLPSGFKFKFTT